MPPLHLPACPVVTRQEAGKTWIFDPLRRKYVVLTPEEWVRQHFVHLLLGAGGYARTLIRAETGVRVNRLARRTDLLVYTRTGDPYLLVECKAPAVPLTAGVFEQAARYNHTLQAPYLVLTNGLETRCWARVAGSQTYQPMTQLPRPDQPPPPHTDGQ